MTELAIVSRTAIVEHLAEGPTIDLSAAYPYPESAQVVRLTREMLEGCGGQALHLGRAWAARLHLLTLSDAGVTEGIPLGTHGTVTVILTGTEDTVIPARTTVGPSSAGPLWQTGAASSIPHGGTTRELVVTCQDAGPIAAVAHSLDTIYPAVPGLSAVDNAADATPGTSAALTLRILDRRVRSLVQSRSSAAYCVGSAGAYQLEADPDQHPLVAVAPLLAGHAGRLVLRWAAADALPPPVGLWEFELVVAHPDGSSVDARGNLEVLA
jgi:hypothetical protein